MRRLVPVLAVMMLAGALLVAGCAKPSEPEPTPMVAPPAIITAGTLTAGIDLSTPPFGGVDAGREAGLDVDVAAALADKLGLTLTVVDVKPSDAATALADGSVDVVLSVPLDGPQLSSLALSGTYATNGPAFFVSTGSTQSVEPSLTLDTLDVELIGAQQDSLAYWTLINELGEEAVESYGTLREALEALDRDEIELVAGDAFVAAYIARDLPTVHYAGQLRDSSPLSVATGSEATALGDAVREALDVLAADGVLDTLRRKWVGELPELSLPASEASTSAP
ncbi:MAG: transporter substrate-binding domain-containing protein [Coriobacteriia bacterium]|nr:transporter substrate-binding domain-containing protein [Coriobacteriia bacterium]